MSCKFCGNTHRLVKSHIIPEGFFRRLRKGGTPKIIRDGGYPARSQIGVYDRSILCNECERLFGRWDDYAQSLLVEHLDPKYGVRAGKDVICYELPQYNYELFKLFCISLLWRSAVSTHRFFDRVKLGPYEKIAKEMLLDENPGSSDIFGVVVAYFDHELGGVILDPHPDRLPPGINYVRFYLGRYIIYIKVDKRKVPHPFTTLQMAADKPLRILVRDLEMSRELPLLFGIVARTEKLLKNRGAR